MRYLERIPLEQFAYIEVEAENFNELLGGVKVVKEHYATRLHKVAPAAPYSSQEPFSPGLGMKESGMTCPKCNAVMEFRQGVSKKNGKPWKGYFCPNSSQEDNHPPKFIKWTKN